MINSVYGNTHLDVSVSSEIINIASQNPNSNIKILHNDNLDPLAYAIGFGCKTNSSIIVGGLNEDDVFSQNLLLSVARAISHAQEENTCIFDFNVNKIFSKNGLWLIPKFCSLSNKTSAIINIIEKFDPKQLIELKPCGEKISYYSSKSNGSSARLFSYILAASTGYSLSSTADENSLAKWFNLSTNRSSYTIHFGKQRHLNELEENEIFTRLLESILIFSAC